MSLYLEILNSFDSLIDGIDYYNKEYPSRAASIAKTELETARLWFAESPDPALSIEPEEVNNDK